MRSTIRRAAVLGLSVAMLLLLAMPAPAHTARPFVSPQLALEWNQNAVNTIRAFTRPLPAAAGSVLFQAESIVYMSYVQAAVYDATTKIAGRSVP